MPKHIFLLRKNVREYGSTGVNSTGPSVFVRYNCEDSCSIVAIWDQKYQ